MIREFADHLVSHRSCPTCSVTRLGESIEASQSSRWALLFLQWDLIIVSGRTADTQFQLQPGQSRNATFNLIRFEARPPIGSAWGYDVVIDELEILPGQQVRTARENSLNFQSLTARAFASAAVPGLPVAAGALQTDALPTDAQEIANDVIGLFNKLKRK